MKIRLMKLSRGLGLVMLLASIGALSWLPACDGGDDDDSSGYSEAEKADARAKCGDLASAYCNKAAECENEVFGDECKANSEDMFLCADAVAVGANYDKCLDEIGKIVCDNWNGDIPDICKGIVTLEGEE